MRWGKNDQRFMQRAIGLAAKGEGKISPNPLVGAVVVKGGRVIGEGFHEKFGGPHAEANALRGVDARGATLYVTLEPCCPCNALKKTPACVPLIIKSGVRRVVIAARDLNQDVCGIEEMRASGIIVEEGLLDSESRQQNEAFFHFLKTGRPLVIVKMAQSSDGCIGLMGKSNFRISCGAFDSHVQRLRNRYDAILVGINTVLADNPRLTCRLPHGGNPARIVLDSRLRIPLDSNVLKNAKKERVIIATSEAASMKRASALEKLGAALLIAGKKEVDMRLLLHRLPAFGIISVLIEGGAKVSGAALAENLADRAVVAVSRKKIGGKGAIASPFTKGMLKKFTKRKMGADTIYEGNLRS